MQMNLARGVQLSCTSQAQLKEGLLAAAGQGSRPASPPARRPASPGPAHGVGRGAVASTGTGVEDREPEPEPEEEDEDTFSESYTRELYDKEEEEPMLLDSAVCCKGKCGACHTRPCRKTRNRFGQVIPSDGITCWKVFHHHHVPRSLETLREQRAELLTARDILMHGEMEVVQRLLAIRDPDSFSSRKLFNILNPAYVAFGSSPWERGASRQVAAGTNMVLEIDDRRQQTLREAFDDIGHVGRGERRPGFTTISRISKELEEVEHRIAFIEGIHTKLWVGMLTLAYTIAQYFIMKKINDLEDGGSGEF